MKELSTEKKHASPNKMGTPNDGALLQAQKTQILVVISVTFRKPS